MNKKTFTQITIFILISGSLTGMLVGTDVYNDVQDGIVEILCLSCLKLDPKTTIDFNFESGDGSTHPDFVTDNLTSGIVFLHYSEDACRGCDIMLPVVQGMFSVDFEKKSMFTKHITYNSKNITYFYINLDHSTKEKISSFDTYDVDDVNGLPMFSVVTLGYDKGIIKPKYATLYGSFGQDTDEKRREVLENVIDDAIELWNENIPGYEK